LETWPNVSVASRVIQVGEARRKEMKKEDEDWALPGSPEARWPEAEAAPEAMKCEGETEEDCEAEAVVEVVPEVAWTERGVGEKGAKGEEGVAASAWVAEPAEAVAERRRTSESRVAWACAALAAARAATATSQGWAGVDDINGSEGTYPLRVGMPAAGRGIREKGGSEGPRGWDQVGPQGVSKALMKAT